MTAPAKGIDDDLTHHEIGFRDEGFIWSDGAPFRPNLQPFAAQLHDWMQQKGGVTYFVERDMKHPLMFTNPYTPHASTIALCWQTLINDGWQFAHATTETAFSTEAEIRYIRLRSELLLYGCRLVEAIVKQMLHCTTFPRRYYKNAALGQLIGLDCRSCRKDGKTPHRVSMLGSIGHLYGLCRGYEDCLNGNIRKLAALRNKEGSHATISTFTGATTEEARNALKADVLEIGNLVHHILKHLREYEERVINDLEVNIRLATSAFVEMKIPISEWDAMFPRPSES